LLAVDGGEHAPRIDRLGDHLVAWLRDATERVFDSGADEMVVVGDYDAGPSSVRSVATPRYSLDIDWFSGFRVGRSPQRVPSAHRLRLSQVSSDPSPQRTIQPCSV